MKVLSMLTLALGIFFGSDALGQPTDTLINVGNYQLHFNVTPGVGIPIILNQVLEMMDPFGTKCVNGSGNIHNPCFCRIRDGVPIG